MKFRVTVGPPLAVTLLLVALLSFAGCKKAAPHMAGQKWADALNSSDAKLRKKAVFKLGNIGTSDPAVFPALIGALKDSDPKVRSETVFSIVKLGRKGREAIPALTEVQLSDGDEGVRGKATQALEILNR